MHFASQSNCLFAEEILFLFFLIVREQLSVKKDWSMLSLPPIKSRCYGIIFSSEALGDGKAFIKRRRDKDRQLCGPIFKENNLVSNNDKYTNENN